MRVRIQFGCLIAALSLSGCGGGSAATSRPPSRPPPSPPPPAISKAEGIWSGTTLVRCDVFGVWGLVTHENSLFVGTPVGVYIGTITDDSLNVTAVRYNYGEVPLVLSAHPDAIQLEITGFRKKSYLDVKWDPAPPFCTQGGSAMNYRDLYERRSSLPLIAGVYTDGSLTIAVNADGSVTGSDLEGCVLNGTVEVVHADRNYYPVVVDVDNCSAAGHYEGAAYLDDGEGGGTNNALQIAAANPDYAIWRRLVK